jgi:hypothetical protein
MAECLQWHLSRPSRAVSKNYHLPWASTHTADYLAALSTIIRDERVDLLLPTCEEIYYIVESQDALTRSCRILAPQWDLLHSLHSKWQFVQLAKGAALAVPSTELLTRREQVDMAFSSGRELVFKPVYSRFASRTVVRPETSSDLTKVVPTCQDPWVAQEYIAGKPISTYSLAHAGKLLAHVAYPMNFTTGIGPTFAYEPIVHPASLAWVTKLVAAKNVSGQIAFDFIERDDGSVVAIECNPRSTSGLHLFRERVDLAHAIVFPELHTGGMLEPTSRRPAQHALPLLLWALGYVRSWRELRRWARTFLWGRDVLLSFRDPLPLLLVGLNLAPMFSRARKHGVTLDQATTIDIEWNGVRSPGEYPRDPASGA